MKRPCKWRGPDSSVERKSSLSKYIGIFHAGFAPAYIIITLKGARKRSAANRADESETKPWWIRAIRQRRRTRLDGELKIQIGFDVRIERLGFWLSTIFGDRSRRTSRTTQTEAKNYPRCSRAITVWSMFPFTDGKSCSISILVEKLFLPVFERSFDLPSMINPDQFDTESCN